jgi:ubiquinone/menaquinone biosynthesis C-methylase UbiE
MRTEGKSKLSLFLDQCPENKGVCIADASAGKEFETGYLNVRQKEGRVLNDSEVIELPHLKNHKHSREWALRAKSAKRLKTYFQNSNQGFLLDLGCGNGWFSNLLAKNFRLQVAGLDVNQQELEQAARLFSDQNIFFIRGDIFHISLPEQVFSYVTVNASIQYFQDPAALINRLFELLIKDGEIHIIDSPFYKQNEVAAARERTRAYYSSLGFAEMHNYYFHHTWEVLEPFNFEILYKPKISGKLFSAFSKPDIPFPWIKIKRNEG